MSTVRTVPMIVLLFLVMALAATAIPAESPAPLGKVSIESTSIAAGIGLSWGNGKLSFEGSKYGFSIDGLTYLDYGISKTNAVGEVYNLTDVAQFEGTYAVAEAGVVLGGGIGGLWLRNQNGVTMVLHSASQGVRLRLGASGMTIKFWNRR